MNVRKRGLALLMCICMIFTLLPFSAFADASSEPDVVYGTYDESGTTWTQKTGLTADGVPYTNSATGANVRYSKTATPVEGQEDTYNITLKIESKTSSTAPGASAVVLVIDISTSMYQCTECGKSWEDGKNHSKECSYYNRNSKSNKVSFEQTRLYAARNAAVNFVNSYAGAKENSGRYLQIVSFQGYAYKNLSNWMDVSNASDRNDVISVINALEPVYKGKSANGTNLEQGLSKAKSLITSVPNGIAKDKKFAVVLTDGEPNRQGSESSSWYVKSETDAAASSLRSAANVYTVCFGAADKESSYLDDMKVGAYLSGTVASNPSNAFNANSAAELNKAFEDIFKSIEQGLSSGFTVTDPMGKYIQLQETTLPDCTIDSNGTITWMPTNGEVSEENGVKTYTYELTYTVKLDTSADGFVDNQYYPTNGVTTLAFKDGDNDITREFNVPGVKGESPKYNVTYEYTGTVPTGAPKLPGEASYKAGEPVNVAAAPTLDGYKFSGWSTSDADVNEGSFTMPSKNVTLTGSWALRSDLSYTVHYYWNGTNDTVADDKVVDGQTFGQTYTEKPIVIDGCTPVSTDSQTITIRTGTNEIIFYYYKNVELKANSANATYDGKEHSVSGFTGAPEGADFSAIKVGATGIEAGTYPANFAEGTKGTVDATEKYIVTETTNGKLTIDPAYQIIYEYKNAPENAPTCPVDNAYYADGTTVSPLQNPGTLDGYIFSGWKINGEGDAVNSVTFDGANITLIGEWKPVEGLTCTINYYWMGDTENPMKTKTVDNLTFGQSFSASPETFDGYTVENGDEQTITIKTTGNVINFYYYKNVVLTASSDSATYNGNTHTVKNFKAIVAADGNADIAAQLDYISALGEGKDAGEYPVRFMLHNERIPVDSLKYQVLNDFYYVTSASEGTLTIKPRTVTITSGSASKTYDGTPLTKHESTITGDGFVEGQGVNITYTGSQTEVGDSPNTFEYQFKDNTLKKNYTIEPVFGTLTVEKRPYRPNPPITDKITVEITGNSDSVVYDGTEHSVKDYTVKISDSRYTEKDFTFSGKALASGINAGTYEMGLKADQFKNTNARFANVEFIIKADGVLTITQRPLTITAGSAEGIAPVTCDKYTVEGLATGDKVDSVKITGIQSEPGESPNVASDAVIKNAKGEDVTANYKITYVNGVLKAIEVLNKEVHFNYVIGYTDGTIRPNNDISRAEVATIFFRLLTDEAREQYNKTTTSFSDIKDGAWCCRAVATLANMGIINGYTDGTFQPNKSITRAELATIIARFAKLDVNTKTFSDITGHWAQKNIELAAGNGWINGYEDGTFRPNNNITRAETFAMINRVLDRQTESVSDLLPTSDMNMWSDNLNENAWYYKDVQEATNYHKCDRVGDSVYEKWTEKVPDIDWASYQI